MFTPDHPFLAWEGLTEMNKGKPLAQRLVWTHIIFVNFNTVFPPDDHKFGPILVAHMACCTILLLVEMIAQSF